MLKTLYVCNIDISKVKILLYNRYMYSIYEHARPATNYYEC